MNGFSRISMLGVLTLGVLAGGLRAGAADFDLSVTNAPSPIIVGNTLTYNIFVTNTSGADLGNVFITNSLPASVTLLGATNSPGVILTNVTTTNVLFQIRVFTNGTYAQMLISGLATAAGFITNTVIVTATNTTSVTTNLVSEVYLAQSDLSVTMAFSAAPVIVNDLMTYSILVTNLGPHAAPNVMLTNISFAPGNLAYTFTGSNLTFSLGTIASNGWSRVRVTLQPTLTGTNTFSAYVTAANVLDTNLTNNFATNNVIVGDYLAGQIEVSIVSTQKYDPQTGLMEQIIRLKNTGTTDVASARVIVSNLLSNSKLFNAVGTNNGNPFVTYNGTLTNDQTVDLLLEYFVPTRLAIPDPALAAGEVPPYNPPPPGGTPVHITLFTFLPPNDFFPERRLLIEFQSVTNQTYTVLYYDDGNLTNTLVAQPSTLAPGDRVQWIDYGPPKTVKRPAQVKARFYRVVKNTTP